MNGEIRSAPSRSTGTSPRAGRQNRHCALRNGATASCSKKISPESCAARSMGAFSSAMRPSPGCWATIRARSWRPSTRSGILLPASRIARTDYWRACGEQKSLTQEEICFRHKDGGSVWILANMNLVEAEDEAGRAYHHRPRRFDISERKESSEALPRKPEALRGLHAPSSRSGLHEEPRWGSTCFTMKPPRDCSISIRRTFLGKTDHQVWPVEYAERFVANDSRGHPHQETAGDRGAHSAQARRASLADLPVSRSWTNTTKCSSSAAWGSISPSGGNWRISSGSRRKWKRSAGWPAEWRTTSTIC